jgi:MFS transporter, DHA1 family, multidrug resistance protein
MARDIQTLNATAGEEQSRAETDAGPGQTEFVLLIALIMMLVAFAIDAMLPALPAIGKSFRIGVENRQQFVMSVFLIGFGMAQIFVGSLSDRFGRRGLLLGSMLAYTVCSLLAAFATSFELLLAARAAQGVAAAGGRVIVTSIVRDRYEGRRMAQVMSLASMIFMAAPILAPSFGQMVLAVGPWRWIFIALGLLGFGVFLWTLIRLPESLPVTRRKSIAIDQLIDSFATVLKDRQSLGYTGAMTCLNAALLGFITSVQQIYADVFHRADFLPYGFAIAASGMALASLTNASIVMRYGMRFIGHWGIISFTVIAGLHLVLVLAGHESLVIFVTLQTLMMIGFSFAGANFSAMAMENMGDVAGTASSLQGCFSTVVGTVLGAWIGQSFNGTTLPLCVGYVIGGLVAILIVLLTERGNLFVARHAHTSPI